MLNFLREQLAMMKLTKAQAHCRRWGHMSGETILWAGRLRLTCPTCGKELDG